MTDPKPPAASGDHYDEMAEALRNAADTSDVAVAAALRAAAKEAQLRLIDHYSQHARSLDGDLMGQLRARIEKEGPL